MTGKVGRPTVFSESLTAVLLERIADGESLRAICTADDMPHRATVFRWLSQNEEFRDQYARAREEQADALFDELLEIADDGSNDWMERKNRDDQSIGWVENGEALRRSALRIEARKWMASKLLPKKYGDKTQMEVSGAGGGPLQVVIQRFSEK